MVQDNSNCEFFVQNTIEQDETVTYEKNQWMNDNLLNISGSFKFGEACNLENFLNPKVVRQTKDEFYSDSDYIHKTFGQKTGQKTLWKPDKLKVPRTRRSPDSKMAAGKR